MEGSSEINSLHRPFYAQETMIEYVNGGRLKRYFMPVPKPFPYDDHERKQMKNLDPFQVFSCWNGAAVIDPRGFFTTLSNSNDGVTQYPSGKDIIEVEEDSQMPLESLGPKSDSAKLPREMEGSSDSSSPIRFRTARNDVSSTTEKASECFLLCVDLWRRGMGKILMVPRARCVLFRKVSYLFM